MKRILSLILAAMVTASMAGCGAKNPPAASTPVSSAAADQVEIDYWHAMSGVNEEAMKKITDDFMVQNPHIKVNLVNQGKYTDLFDKLMASAKANQMPVISQVYSNRLSWYIAKDLVTDLTPYMQAAGTGFTQEDLADFPKMFLDDGIWNGKQYAMPFNKSQMVLYYNEGMLKDAGVEVPKTWAEWTEASKKLTVDKDGDGTPEIYGTVFANNLSTDIAPWFKQAGGDTMDEATNTLYFDTPESAEAVNFLNNMIQSKTARLAGDDKSANVPLQQGRAAMCVASTSALPYIEKDTAEGIIINAAELPAHKTDDQLFYGTNVAVFNSATDAQKQAAWDYIKFLTNTQNTAYFAAQTGYIPVRKSAKDDPVFKKVLDEKPIKMLPFTCMDRGFQGARNIGEINALNALGDELQQVFAGKKSVADALKSAQELGTKAMEQARNS